MKFIKHTIKKGENLTKIAKAYGFSGSDWKKIYDHPKNAAFRKLRPDPNLIQPKDEIFVPETAGKNIDEEIKSLEFMLAQLQAMPPSVKSIIMESKRMSKEALRITKNGALINADIATMRAMQAQHRAEITVIDAMSKKYEKGQKSSIAYSPKSFANFQKRQEALAKLINTLKTIDDAEKHLIRDPKKAMFAVGALGKDMVKIQKLTSEWTKAHQDAVKEIEARLKELRNERKLTI